MEQFNKAKVVLLPTKHKSKICLYNNILHYVIDGEFNLNREKYNLYIISDDEIKEDDYCYYPPFGIGNVIYEFGELCYRTLPQENKGSLTQRLSQTLDKNKKIIATTDTLVIKNMYDSNGVREVDFNINVPQPSQQFINQYIESYNKGKVITDVLVEYIGNLKVNSYHENGDPNKSDSHYIFYPKINPDNTITIKLVKDSWNREEVIKAMMWAENNAKHYTNSDKLGQLKQFNDWIDKNL